MQPCVEETCVAANYENVLLSASEVDPMFGDITENRYDLEAKQESLIGPRLPTVMTNAEFKAFRWTNF